MNKRHLPTSIALAIVTITACGGTVKNESEQLGEIRIFDFPVPSSSGSNKPLPSSKQCPINKPYYNAFGDSCFNDGPQFCQFNLNCTDTSAPFCYHGICSDVDPAKEDPCQDLNDSASFNGECYDPWFDSSSCGGYTHICGAGTYCQQGFCVDGSINCPQDTPHSFNGKCYNLFSDNENCDVVGQVCPASKPTCYLGRCYDSIPGKLVSRNSRPELELGSLRPYLTKPL